MKYESCSQYVRSSWGESYLWSRLPIKTRWRNWKYCLLTTKGFSGDKFSVCLNKIMRHIFLAFSRRRIPYSSVLQTGRKKLSWPFCNWVFPKFSPLIRPRYFLNKFEFAGWLQLKTLLIISLWTTLLMILMALLTTVKWTILPISHTVYLLALVKWVFLNVIHIFSQQITAHSFRRKSLVLNISFKDSFISNENKTWSEGPNRKIYVLLKRFRFSSVWK